MNARRFTLALRLWPTNVWLLVYGNEIVLRSNGWFYGRWLEIPR